MMIPASIRQPMKRLVFGARLALGQHRAAIAAMASRGVLPILNLHRVSPEANHFWSPLEPRLFDELVAFLKGHFRLVTFGELGKALPGPFPPMILSFDDGFLDFAEHAAPILRKHGVSANMNIIPKYTAEGGLPWNILLYDFLQRAPEELVRELELPEFSGTQGLSSLEQKRQAGLRISRYLKNLPRAEREAIFAPVRTLIARWGQAPALRMMSTSEVKEISRAHEIGVHSWAHDSMGFESMETFSSDFHLCQKYFSTRLALPMKIYAFPNGSYRQEQVEWLLANGMEQVLLVDDHYSRAGERVHRRLTVTGDSLPELKIRSLCRGDRPRPDAGQEYS